MIEPTIIFYSQTESRPSFFTIGPLVCQETVDHVVRRISEKPDFRKIYVLTVSQVERIVEKNNESTPLARLCKQWLEFLV